MSNIKIENPKLENEEDKILGKEKEMTEVKKEENTLENGTLFEVYNIKQKTKSTYPWSQLRHMFDKKVEKDIFQNKGKGKFKFKDIFEITLKK